MGESKRRKDEIADLKLHGRRKHLSEYTLGLYSARWIMIPASELANIASIGEDWGDIAKQCHIYMICSRPAVFFDPKTFNFNGKTISGNLTYKIKGQEIKVPFQSPFTLMDGASSVRLEYPYREIETVDATGRRIRFLTANHIAWGIQHDAGVLRELEVLYIGQAFGDGTRSAFDRLKNHSTLQRILADTNYKNPDDEIFLLAFEYKDHQLLTMFDGRSRPTALAEIETPRFKNILDNPLTEYQRICLAEAGLIRYFQPHYNAIYRESFPAADQKILASCYDLDFSGLAIEINTDDLHHSLKSQNVTPQMHHIAKFDLYNPETRMSFFAITLTEGEVFSLPDVIPPSR